MWLGSPQNGATITAFCDRFICESRPRVARTLSCWGAKPNLVFAINRNSRKLIRSKKPRFGEYLNPELCSFESVLKVPAILAHMILLRIQPQSLHGINDFRILV